MYWPNAGLLTGSPPPDSVGNRVVFPFSCRCKGRRRKGLVAVGGLSVQAPRGPGERCGRGIRGTGRTGSAWRPRARMTNREGFPSRTAQKRSPDQGHVRSVAFRGARVGCGPWPSTGSLPTCRILEQLRTSSRLSSWWIILMPSCWASRGEWMDADCPVRSVAFRGARVGCGPWPARRRTSC